MKTWMTLLLSIMDVSGSVPVTTHDKVSLEAQGRWQQPNLRRLVDVKCTSDTLETKINDELEENEFFFLHGSESLGVVGGAPHSVECMSRESYKCPMVFYGDVVFTDEESIPTTDAFTEQQPCTYCDLRYFKNSTFHNASCETFYCLPDDDIGPIPEEVQFSYEVTRSDSFTTTQYTSPLDNQYRCNWETSRKVYRIDFKTGVANVQTTSLFLEKDSLVNGTETPTVDDGMDTCTYTVDGVPCDLCQICNASDPGLYALDCSNIRPGATATCLEADVNPLLGYFPKLLVLQSDHTASPSAVPTTESSSMMPSSAPMANQTLAPTPNQSPSAQPTTLSPTSSQRPTGDTVLIVAIVVGVMMLLICSYWVYYLSEECLGKEKHDKKEHKVHPSYPEPFNIKLPTPEDLSNELGQTKSVSTPPSTSDHAESWENKDSGHGHNHHQHHHHHHGPHSPHHHHHNHHHHNSEPHHSNRGHHHHRNDDDVQ